MPVRKLYAGVKLRETRGRLGLTQKDFARKLGVSLPYLNQMENNHRPVSTAVVLALAGEFGMDVGELRSGDAERMVSDMREMLADPVFADAAPPLADLRLTASNAPALARAMLDLHRAYRQAHERLASLDEALGRDGAAASPWDEVRDFFHYCDNYIDAMDRAAERFATNPAGGDVMALARKVFSEHGITVEITDGGPAREFARRSAAGLSGRESLPDPAVPDAASGGAADAGQADRRHAGSGAVPDRGRAQHRPHRAGELFRRRGAAALHRVPAGRRGGAPRSGTAGASLRRLGRAGGPPAATLQRPGAKGIPFFFVRVDQAGTITKRHSATRLQFARYGGACPLWNVHRAFETPGRFLDNWPRRRTGCAICASPARCPHRGGGSWGARVARYAIELGCEISHAGRLCYADDLDLGQPPGSTNRSASPAGSASAAIATSARCRRWSGG